MVRNHCPTAAVGTKTQFRHLFITEIINTVKDMKDKINKVVEDLKKGTISKKDAETLLLGLFSVSNCFICSKCGKELYKGWEQAACNFTLNLNIDCQSTKALWGGR